MQQRCHPGSHQYTIYPVSSPSATELQTQGSLTTSRLYKTTAKTLLSDPHPRLEYPLHKLGQSHGNANDKL
eukprot:3156400-Amphidinium_carterae.2